MGDIISIIVLAPLCLGLTIWGIFLIAGKTYRTIAGNQEAADEEINEQRQAHLGKVIGVTMLVIASILGVQLCVSLSALFVK